MNQFSNGQPVFSTAQREITGRYPLVFVLQRVGSLIDVKTLVWSSDHYCVAMTTWRVAQQAYSPGWPAHSCLLFSCYGLRSLSDARTVMKRRYWGVVWHCVNTNSLMAAACSGLPVGFMFGYSAKFIYAPGPIKMEAFRWLWWCKI